VVLWRHNPRKCDYVLDGEGNPTRFRVIHHEPKRTLIRKEGFEYSFQDVKVSNSKLELIERGPIRYHTFPRIGGAKTWLRKGIGVNGGGDYIGILKDNPEIRVLMSWRGINGRRTPAFFKDPWGVWRKIPTNEVSEVVE